MKETGRAKALGQDGVMVLAACDGNQLAWEMDEDDADSVLTYYVLKALKDSDVKRNSDGHVAVRELFEYVEPPVKTYVKKTFGVSRIRCWSIWPRTALWSSPDGPSCNR